MSEYAIDETLRRAAYDFLGEPLRANRIRYRLACLRTGRDCGLEVGDVVIARHDTAIPRDGSEFEDGYPAVIARVMLPGFARDWPWKRIDHADMRILGLLPLPPIKLAAIFYPCAQDMVVLAEPNRFAPDHPIVEEGVRDRPLGTSASTTMSCVQRAGGSREARGRAWFFRHDSERPGA